MTAISYLILFAVALVATVLLVPLVRKFAVFVDAIDYPSGRRVNQTPVPRLGGVAMFGGMCAAFAVMALGLHFGWWTTPLGPHPSMQVDYTLTAAGVLIVFFVGFCDDIYDLHPKAKLIGQIVAAVIVVMSGVVFDGIHNPFGAGYIMFGGWSYPITVIYLVAFANIINLIDGLDGLAAGISTISMATLLVFSVLTSRSESVLFAVVVIGACLGFLRYNHHPASIFMGDSGSLLLGFMLGIVSLLTVTRAALFTSLLVPILAAGVPIIDTGSAIIRRWRGHQPIDQPDKGHIHHRLLEKYGHAKSVHLMWMWTAFLSLGGILITLMHGWTRIVVFLILAAVSFYVVKKLELFEPVLVHTTDPRKSRRHMRDGTFPSEEGGDPPGKPPAPGA